MRHALRACRVKSSYTGSACRVKSSYTRSACRVKSFKRFNDIHAKREYPMTSVICYTHSVRIALTLHDYLQKIIFLRNIILLF
jgi:hypothetical protein